MVDADIDALVSAVLERSDDGFALLPSVLVEPERLFDWDALNEILSTRRLAYPRLRIAANAEILNDEVFTKRHASGERIDVLQASRLHDVLRKGATLVLDSVEELDERVGTAARTLERAVGESVQVNLFASFRPTESFGLHWDDHDAVVVQVAGSKAWTVCGSTRPSGEARGWPAPDQAVWDGDLQSGDALVLRRGFRHTARSVDGPSLHLTFGFRRAVVGDLLTWAATARALEGRLDDDLADLSATAVEEVLAQVTHHLADPAVREAFLTHRARSRWSRDRINLPVAITGSVSMNSRIEVATAEVIASESDVILRTGVEEIVVTDRQRAIVEWSLERGRFSVEELRTAFGQDAADGLRLLLDSGAASAVGDA